MARFFLFAMSFRVCTAKAGQLFALSLFKEERNGISHTYLRINVVCNNKKLVVITVKSRIVNQNLLFSNAREYCVEGKVFRGVLTCNLKTPISDFLNFLHWHPHFQQYF
jgi:hypothetical protein